MRGVERDNVHDVAEAELLAHQSEPRARLGPPVRRIEEELARIKAGFAVDLDGAREIGGALVVEPIVISEPGVELGYRYELARAVVAQLPRRLSSFVEDLVDAVELLEE